MAFDDARGVAVMFGGAIPGEGGPAPRLNDTWEWDGARWIERVAVTVPTPRLRHAMAYDAARKRVLLFGGNTQDVPVFTVLDDTWTWDGTTWKVEMPPGERPSARQDHAMTFDSNRGVVVLFGGTGPSGRLNDTWEWNGERWTRKLTASAPAPREGSAMAFDVARGVTVLFGGFNEAHSDETWEWDGVDWMMRTPGQSPPRRNNHSMAYDSRRGRVVLFGGAIFKPDFTDFQHFDDTWEWDGETWIERARATSPAPRRRTAMAYDSVRENTVLFGGVDDVAVFGDTWLWDGTNWTFLQELQGEPIIELSAKPDGIFQHTTIDIGPGVKVRFAKNAANTPVTWLASGDVTIAGEIDLDGTAGGTNVDPGNEAPGGPGGFDGGLGGKRQSVSNNSAGTPGQGLGGGLAGQQVDQLFQGGGNAGYATSGGGTLGGNIYGNEFLQPLVGGSGGGGSASFSNSDGGNGGGGGGAILIASSGTIRVDGSIHANGGAGRLVSTRGGHGSGGGIRLAANRIEGNGTLSARNGELHATQGLGRIRTEAFVVGLTTTPSPANLSAVPIGVSFQNPATIRIVRVAGEDVPQPPSGSTITPDVVFTQSGFVQIDIETTNIPAGTQLRVRVTKGSQVMEVTSDPVAANGTTRAAVEVPAGVGTIQAFADFMVMP
jgi:hypothetical protein